VVDLLVEPVEERLLVGGEAAEGEGVEGAREHGVEDGVDGVSPAPSRRQLGSEHRREGHPLLVKGQQVVGGEHHADAQRA